MSRGLGDVYKRQGFNQAIELSTEVLSNVKFIQEKKLIGISEMQLTYLFCEMFLYVYT